MECRSVQLLCEAIAAYDRAPEAFRVAANRAWRGGFESGAVLMAKMMGLRRDAVVAFPERPWNTVGSVKYGLSGAAALIPIFLSVHFAAPFLVLLAVPCFYLVEAEMVFLFPLLIDGASTPWRESIGLTRKAGGALSVMLTVLPIAAWMLAGGFFGRGFVRSWCTGCGAVVLWYEELREW